MTAFGHKDPIGRVRRLFGGDRQPAPGPARRPLVVGHRGDPRHLPENTLPSFQRALELGAVAVETDLCLTRDGVLVLWHDRDPSDAVSLARDVGAEQLAYVADWPDILDGDRKPVHEMTLAEMRRACGYSRRTGAGDLVDGDSRPEVPFALFDELLTFAAGEPRLHGVFLDVKLRPEDAARVRLIVDTVAARGRREGLTWHMLLPERELWEALRGVELPPWLDLAPDFERPGAVGEAAELGARRVSMGLTKLRTWGDFQRELAEVVEARDAGALDHVTVWTLNSEEHLRAVAAARVDAILTDDPPLLCRLLG